MHASMARSMELKGRLCHIEKGDSQTMDGYLREIKVIADSFADIQCPVSNQDLVQYILFGLNRDTGYDHRHTEDKVRGRLAVFNVKLPTLFIGREVIRVGYIR